MTIAALVRKIRRRNIAKAFQPEHSSLHQADHYYESAEETLS